MQKPGNTQEKKSMTTTELAAMTLPKLKEVASQLGIEGAAIRRSHLCDMAFCNTNHTQLFMESDFFPLAHDGFCIHRNRFIVAYDFTDGL